MMEDIKAYEFMDGMSLHAKRRTSRTPRGKAMAKRVAKARKRRKDGRRKGKN